MSLQATKRISALSRQGKESNFSLFHFIEVDTASHWSETPTREAFTHCFLSPLLFSSSIMRPFLTNIITTLNSSFRTKAETVRSCAAILLLSTVRLWPQMYSCQKLSPIINSAVCKSNWEIKRFHLTDCAGER